MQMAFRIVRENAMDRFFEIQAEESGRFLADSQDPALSSTR